MSENTAMLSDKNTTVKESSKNIANHLSVTHKHSGLFYISPSLFENKRLRRKRLRWAKALLAAAGFKQHHILQRKRTERRKLDLSKLRADVTIDLLSDDDDANEKSCNVNKNIGLNVSKIVPIVNTTSLPITNGPPPLVPISNLHSTPKQSLPQVYVRSGEAIELSKVPNITLIPVQNLQSMPVSSTPVAQVAPMPRRVKRKRKSQQPKRHEQPTIVNNESIVLSDDSDNEKTAAAPPPPVPLKSLKNTNNSLLLLSPPLTVAAVPRSTSITPTLAQKSPQIKTPVTPPQPSPSTTTYPTMLSPYSAQVDEEVTVSLVPRSSIAGTCPKSNSSELFPMLPDETTVHTVIANRTYELSLTKLREGLASCGMPEFANGQQKITPTRRKGQKVDTPPMVSPTQAPISLKLSSDLSISLISDEDEDDPEQQQRQRLAAESILQKQPQLMVQHLQMPAVGVLPAGANVAIVTAPRRRKLG